MLGLRLPMIKAQGTPKVPAGKSFIWVPGITTEFAGTRPFNSTGDGPVTSMIFVLAVMVTPAPRTAPSSIKAPSTTMQRLPMKTLSSMMTGLAWTGSKTPPMPTPPDRCTFLPICAHEPTVAQVSTMVPEPT